MTTLLAPREKVLPFLERQLAAGQELLAASDDEVRAGELAWANRTEAGVYRALGYDWGWKMRCPQNVTHAVTLPTVEQMNDPAFQAERGREKLRHKLGVLAEVIEVVRDSCT